MDRTNDNQVLREYFEACEEIKRLEAVKEGLKAHIFKLVPKGKIECVDYIATISKFTETRISSKDEGVSAVDALIAKFGKRAMNPFLKKNIVKKVVVKRRAEEKVVLVHDGKSLEFRP